MFFKSNLQLALVALITTTLVYIAQSREIPGLDSEAIKPIDGQDTGFTQAFIQAFMMILVTEIGDETFIIAAIMAMRHPRITVYSGAMAALTFMTVISTALGYVLPNLISPTATHHAATILYTIFGIRLYWIAYKSDPNEVKEEIDEVEEKLNQAEVKAQSQQWKKLVMGLLTPVFLEAMVLTFLAEWGDRGQIATITLATQYNPIGVTLGATIGHALCTGAAVTGGQLLALKVSQRTVAIAGGSLFLVFAFHNVLTS